MLVERFLIFELGNKWVSNKAIGVGLGLGLQSVYVATGVVPSSQPSMGYKLDC